MNVATLILVEVGSKKENVQYALKLLVLDRSLQSRQYLVKSEMKISLIDIGDLLYENISMILNVMHF